MAVKSGYKQTEVGVIPEDWEVKRLGECVVGRPSYGINAAAVPYSDKLPIYIRITDISEEGRFLPDNLVSVNSEHSAKYYLADGDIVFARTGASVGKSYRYNLIDGPLVYAGFLIRVRPNSGMLLTTFLAGYVTTERYWQWVRTMSMRSGQPGINGTEFSRLPIPLPPLPEQKAIAQALSDMDALISGLDDVIAKKRDIKQATMQQLLTGKTRLPGFSGEWEVKTLGELLKVRHGKSQHDIVTSDGVYPILASGGEIGRTNAYIYNQPSVLIGRKGTIDSPQYVETPFWTVDTLFFTEIGVEAFPKFVFYKFKMIQWRSYNEASGVPSLNAKTIESIEVNVPPLPEQQAIATVLSDIDDELAALEQRREKTRELKQAMMQELLTGRTRLV